jgi:hypothetical protein
MKKNMGKVAKNINLFEKNVNKFLSMITKTTIYTIARPCCSACDILLCFYKGSKEYESVSRSLPPSLVARQKGGEQTIPTNSQRGCGLPSTSVAPVVGWESLGSLLACK